VNNGIGDKGTGSTKPLQRAGLVELPAPQRTKVNRPRQNYKQMPLFVQTRLGGTLAEHPAVRLQQVQGAAEHYSIGYCHTVCLQHGSTALLLNLINRSQCPVARTG
jgi:hypothetical protein